MTADPVIPAAVYGVCTYCARLRPLQADGLLAIHYLRRRVAGRDRRRRCPGSRHLPREDTR